MSTTINILSTNDIHGRFLGGFGGPGEIDFSCLRTLKESLDNSLLVDIGDATQGTPLAILHNGLDPIEIMNDVGYDVVTIGNHEFDNITLKSKDTNELDTIIEKCRAPFICSNVYWNHDYKQSNPNLQNYIEFVYEKAKIKDRGNGRYFVKEIAGKKLLFVGVCTPIISDTEKMKTYVIKGKPGGKPEDSMVVQVRSAISAAKEKHGKFDAVILLTHLGKDDDKNSSSTSWGATDEYKYTSTDLIASLTREDRKEIKLVIDGHSHKKYFVTPTEKESDMPYLLQADCYGKLCACIKLIFDDNGGLKITNEFLEAKDVNKYSQNDAVRTKIITVKRKVEEEFGTELCKGSNTTLWGGALNEERPFVPKGLTAKNITRHIHTNMGRLAAMAMVHYIRTNKAQYFDAEANYIIAGMNGGAIRDSIRFGKTINYGMLYDVTPSQREGKYDSGIAVLKISLSKLKKVLEHSVSGIGVKDDFLSTNAGMFLNTYGLKYGVYKSKTESNKVEIHNSITLTCGVNDMVRCKNISLEKDKDKKVLICVNKYVASGGDQYPFGFDDPDLVKDSLNIDTPMYQIVGDYIKILAEANQNMLFTSGASDDVQYSGFTFPKPQVVEVTVKDEKGKKVDSQKIVYAFANHREYHNFGVTVTDKLGMFSVIPPEGANTLCVAVLLGEALINNTFLYGEVFTHSYLNMERRIGCQVANMDISAYCLFSKNHLSQFKHSYWDSDHSHYSNYLDYIDENGNNSAFTVVNHQIYSSKYPISTFKPVSAVTYTNAAGGKSILTLPFPKGGIDYMPWAGKPQKVHADLINNSEISDYYGGGGQTMSSTYCDGTLFAKNHQNKMIGIHIRSGEILDGIGFIYAGDEEFFIGNPYGGAGTHIPLDRDEYIMKMEGAVNEIYPYYRCISNLYIITNKRKHGPFGTHMGKEKFLLGENGKMITAILGEETTQDKWRNKIVKQIAVAYIDIKEVL